MLRLFVAIFPPDDEQAGLTRFCGGVPGARWTAEENIHLTLRFIGEVDEGQAEDIDEALATVSAQPFSLMIKGVGAFDDRLLWAGIADGEPVVALRRKVESALRRAGLPPDGRRFAPHLTIARMKRPDMARVGEFLMAHSLYQGEPFLVDGFSLVSSVLGGEQALYREEARYPLQ